MGFFRNRIEAVQFRLGWGNPQQTLFELLSKADSSVDFEDQVRWLNELVDWIRLPVLPGESESKNKIQNSRLRFMFQVMDRHDELRAKVSDTLQSILLNVDPVSLFCQVDLSQDQGFFSELWSRFTFKFIPRYSDPSELAELFQQIFRDSSDIWWVASLEAELLKQLMGLFGRELESKPIIAAKMSDAMLDASLILSSRVMSISVHPDMRSRLPRRALDQSPFFQLNEALVRIRTALSSGKEINSIAPETHRIVKECLGEIRQVHLGIQAAGASVELIYRLERAAQGLRRIDRLMTLLAKSSSGSISDSDIGGFLVELLIALFHARSLRGLLQTNLYLQSLKIVEYTGQSGEVYLPRTRPEYFALFRSAAGGGLIAAFTSLFKILIYKMSLPTFFEGLLSWINYSGSFIAMQLFHFTLATKTPSATAATLANRLGGNRLGESEELTKDVAAITRSGMASILGNLGLVIPMAILLEFAIHKMIGRPPLSQASSLQIIREIHPFKSLTVFYSFATAGALWLSAIGGGWLENWFIFARLNRAIAESRPIKKFFGEKTSRKISNWFERNINGLGTNIFLGFLLSLFSVLHEFLGLPIDVRHVTLTTGKAVFAVCSLNSWHGLYDDLTWAAAGIVLIGFINFGASFLFSFFFAARAKGMDLRASRSVLLGLTRQVLKSPVDFFLPTRKLSAQNNSK